MKDLRRDESIQIRSGLVEGGQSGEVANTTEMIIIGNWQMEKKVWNTHVERGPPSTTLEAMSPMKIYQIFAGIQRRLVDTDGIASKSSFMVRSGMITSCWAIERANFGEQ